MDDDRKLLWEPSEDWIKNANITRFIEFVNRNYGQKIKGGKDLYKFSFLETSSPLACPQFVQGKHLTDHSSTYIYRAYNMHIRRYAIFF